MNEVSIKLTCPCGAGFEIQAEDNNRAWVRSQAQDWQLMHRRCVSNGQRLTLPEELAEGAGVKVKTVPPSGTGLPSSFVQTPGTGTPPMEHVV